MFIIAGISPRIKTLDGTPRICPSCGLAQAYLKRSDSYFSLFFIPLFRVKKGESFIRCERCETVVSDKAAPFRTWKAQRTNQCKSCGKTMDKGFVYCPYCGKPVA
ncbi:MAG: zinc ribbon domain-containing protein [Desulfobacterales bacterium]|nr:zinc ribbon domain-containing protein [Desulfobacterales bacterium]